MDSCTVRNCNIEQLAKILSATELEDTDVTLVCAGSEFNLHRHVLESSSTYFAALLHSGLDESTNGRVLLNGTDTKTLAIVLNFIYTSELQATTLEDLCQVMSMAQVMDLKQLVKKCHEAFVSILSTDNYLKIWSFADLGETNSMLNTKVMEYVLSNFPNIVHTKDFVSVTFDQLRTLISFSTSLVQSQDAVLHGLIVWIQHDLKPREKFAEELFGRVSAELVTKQCLRELLEDKNIKNSTELTMRLNELAVAVFVFANSSTRNTNKVPHLDSKCKSLKITFIGEYKIQTAIDKTSQEMTERVVRCNTIQQFDVKSMTWCQPKTLPLMGFKGAAMCQHQNNIYMVGGSLGSVCIKYNIDLNIADYIQCREFRDRKDASMCVFKDELYVIGGRNNDGPKSSVHHASPKSNCWEVAKPLQYPRSSSTILTSADHIYVVGGNNPLHGTIIECFYYSENYEETRWEIIRNPPKINGYEIITSGFFVAKHVLTGIHSAFGELVRWSYDHGRRKWVVKRFHTKNACESQITGVCNFPNPDSSLIYFPTQWKSNPIPNCSWDTVTYKWKELPAAKGKCEIQNYKTVQRLYLADVTPCTSIDNA